MDSATFSPLPHVNVRIKNGTRGTTTDLQGNFGLTASTKDTLVFTLVGYNDIIYPLIDWEPSIIRMSEKRTLLNPVLIRSTFLNPYEGMFDDQNALLNKRKIPFYLARYKKEKIKVRWLLEDNLHAKTYVDLLIKDHEMKMKLMIRHSLSEDQYYKVLGRFNEQYVNVMYYLTTAELATLLTDFFDRNAKSEK